jgi:putative ABC transport system permease protein
MKHHQPPKLARYFFEWYCGLANINDLLGDLDEMFYHYLKTKSVFVAKLKYWISIFSLMFSYAIRKRKRDASLGQFSSSFFSVGILHSYLKVAVRNLYQHKYFSVLNAFGLAIGMSISLLLISMYSYIGTYDNFHANKENIYSIESSRTEGIDQRDFASSPIALGEKIENEFTGVKEVVRIYASFYGDAVLEKENIGLQGYYTDSNFLSVFSFPLLSGNAGSALTKPNTIVLTETAAEKLFATTDVVGQSIAFKDLGVFEITGVMKDYPKNTQFRFEALTSYASLPQNFVSTEQQWTHYQNQFVYLLFDEKTKPSHLQNYLNQLAEKSYAKSPIKASFELQALENVVTSEVSNSIGPQWEISGFIVFGVIALLILLPACFNYTNISIARALKRSKEIGLRKTMGGVKNQIFFQFITETVVITLISLIGAFGIFTLIRSEFQSMLVESSSLDLGLTIKMAALFIVFALFTGFLAGGFPAMYFAGLNPIEALKGKTSTRALSGMRIKKGLTIFQFALSFCFILSLFVFGRQYHTLINFDFGFQKDNIVNVELQNAKPELVKTEFSKLAVVESISLSSGSPGLSSSRTWVHTLEEDSIETAQLFVDADFIQNFKMDLLAGKNFPTQFSGEERYILVNEQFLSTTKITINEAIGKVFMMDGKEMAIVGVLKNFHYLPPPHPIGNFIFRFNPSYFSQANLVVNISDVFGAFTSMEKTWKAINEGEPFTAKFFTDELNDSYFVYRYLLKIAGFLGLLALTISILGLLGMVVYTSETRMKEVSVRKVLGASVFGISLLLSKDYLKLLGWAILFGVPIAVLIHQVVFTQIPNYNASLSVWDILFSALSLIVLGILTIASQTYKTAMTNPAQTLKAE